MKPIVPLLAAASILLAGGLHAEEAASDKTEATEREEVEANARLPSVDLTPRLLYLFLLAEIAGQRGQMASATELYRDIARETRDPRIARRATELALHARRTDMALDAARVWLEVEPDSAQARQTVVSLLAAHGRYDELVSVVAGMLAADPQNVGPNLLRLNRLFARGGDRQAIRTLVETVTAPYLQIPEAHYARALAAFEARDMVTARSAITHALELKPDWEAAALFHVQLIENRAEALAALGGFVAAYPQAHEARMAYARALVGEKMYAEARREFGILLEHGASDQDKNGDVIFAVAVLSLQLNDTAQAEKQLHRLIDIGHAEADKARFYLGQIAEEDKRWDESLKWFAQVGRGEHYLTARLHAANVLVKQDKLDLARRQLAEAEVANPRERVQLLIGEAQLLREAGRIADAYDVLTAGLAQQPDQPELLYEIALLAEKMGRADELEKRLRRLIELRPDHAHALNALGYSLAERNVRLIEARELIERALQLAPNDPFILDSKGWVLFRQGDAPAALDVLNTAFTIRADPEIAAHLGEVLWSLGRQVEARQTWEKARLEHPASEALAETIKRFPH
jgi:tetratricopeptide (TPR) repeat protein